uniref:AAA family ATPase n=1 Tax=Frankia sp. CiP1_Cm_nod1 TaxID=2897160 RepID=UPI002023CD5B
MTDQTAVRQPRHHDGHHHADRPDERRDSERRGDERLGGGQRRAGRAGRQGEEQPGEEQPGGEQPGAESGAGPLRAEYHLDDRRRATLTDRCHRLVRFLREIALAQAPRVTTVDEHPAVVWLDDLPDGLSLFEQAGPGEVLLAAPAAAALPPPPALPGPLTDWVVMAEPGEPVEEFPPLREIGPRTRVELRPDGIQREITETIRLADAPEIRAAYAQWLPAWRIWAARARADADRRALHNVLHTVAQRLAQEGDALELVLCTGLLSWQVPSPVPTSASASASASGPASTARPAAAPGPSATGMPSLDPAATITSATMPGRPALGPAAARPSVTGGRPSATDGPPAAVEVRHHLLATRLLVEIDAASSAIRLRLPAEATTRLEDSSLLDGVAAFRPERTNALHERLRGRPAVSLGSDDERVLRDWLTLAVDVSTDGYSPSWQPAARPGPRPQVTFAPALVLRARGRAALLNYYDQMLDALRGDSPPPLGLVQLVETLEADERLAWLAAGTVPAGDVLPAGDAAPGGDGPGDTAPLFPLPANPEQAHVMERLRRDNGVVVEGPPGTGKTHTIANLMSALLAEGKRVLVTSQKAQALRVLREKMPPELQRLCVSLTDLDDTGSTELAVSISALAAEKAAFRPDDHDRRIARLRSRRDDAVARRAELAELIQRLRAAEGVHHSSDDVAPGWEGTLARIAARVRDEHAAHGWLPTPVPWPAAGQDSASAGGNITDSDRGRGGDGAAGGHGPTPASGGHGGHGGHGGRNDYNDHGGRGSRGEYGGPPPAPLDAAEAAELLAVLRSRTPARAHRLAQDPTDPDLLVPTGTIRQLLAAEQAASSVAHNSAATLGEPVAALADRLAGLSPARVDALRAAAAELTDALALVAGHHTRWAWVQTALDDALAGRDAVLWEKIASTTPAVEQAAGALERVGLHTVVLPALTERGPASAQVLLAHGEALRAHLAAGHGLRAVFPSKAQKNAAPLLTEAAVDGIPPRTPDLLDVVLARLTAQVCLETASSAWALVDVHVDPDAAPEVRLARLHDLAGALAAVDHARGARDRVLGVLASFGAANTSAAAGAFGTSDAPGTAVTGTAVTGTAVTGTPAAGGSLGVTFTGARACRDLAAALEDVRWRQRAAAATADLSRIHGRYLAAARTGTSAPELAALAGALAARDVTAYEAARA